MSIISKPIGESARRVQILRPALLLNAIFSGANGLLLALAGPMVASWLGPQATGIYALLGVGLLLFCVTLGLAAWRPTALAALAITGADLAWVISTTAAVLVWRHAFTPLGLGLVLGTNAVVSTLVWFQQRSIRKVFQVSEGAPDEYQVCIAADAPVTAGAFWTVLADLGAIQRYMPALKASALTVGEKSGIGCVRTCENVKGQIWSEKCEEWEEGRSFSVAFLTGASGFPFPFSKMHGGWRVAPSATGSQVQVWWRVVPRRPWAAAVLLPLMAADAQRSFAGVIARMALAAQARPLDSSTTSAFPRLRAVPC